MPTRTAFITPSIPLLRARSAVLPSVTLRYQRAHRRRASAARSAPTMVKPASTPITIHPDDPYTKIANALMPLYRADREKFMRIITTVKHANRHTRPLFPENIDLSAIAPVPEAEREAFKEKYISTTKASWNSPEGKELCKDNGRPVMYARWRWALANMDTYINMLRVYGHSDEKIARMLRGIPMCMDSEAAYNELREALKALAVRIGDELNWKNVGFVFTGSSVPGFSQNPLKGFKDLPSKITDPKKSDVDICIVADGVNVTVANNHSDGDEFNEPKWAFPTTQTEITSGMRFGCKNLREFSKTAADFYDKWSVKLPGGLQFTFCEDDTDIPPWEARINIRDA
ncbi:unnamed protein product [Agarophyton chilense]|eukprot:gb/GEZJ01000197.1/.p1 GENE.gb/GEZJ01000197.1/~~gb/GEZJ01000197.1/.p1  ORF type:complete len:344 (-),score=45.05 gb/GEZJ01000197.1/:515-1546(-)